jgi:hypothetical protein
MARELDVNLSMEWQCEQFASANALPAWTLDSEEQGAAKVKTLKAITAADAILSIDPCLRPKTFSALGSGLHNLRSIAFNWFPFVFPCTWAQDAPRFANRPVNIAHF